MKNRIFATALPLALGIGLIIGLAIPRKPTLAEAARIVADAQRPTPAERAEIERSARCNAAASALQTLRSQLALYHVQHEDQWPTLAQLQDWSPLLITTDKHGQPTQANGFGPYIQQAPISPLTGKSRVVSADHATANAGWAYDQTTGDLRLIVPRTEWQNEHLDRSTFLTPNDILIVD